MSRAVQPLVESATQQASPGRRISSPLKQHRRWLAAGALAVAVAMIVTLLLVARNWPFTRDKVMEDLAEATSSTVAIRSFHQMYFPHPGCVAESVTFRHGIDKANPPLITIKKLMVQGSFMGLFTKHVTRIRAEGLRIIVSRNVRHGERNREYDQL